MSVVSPSISIVSIDRVYIEINTISNRLLLSLTVTALSAIVRPLSSIYRIREHRSENKRRRAGTGLEPNLRLRSDVLQIRIEK